MMSLSFMLGIMDSLFIDASQEVIELFTNIEE
jgi:hypothetical protein